MSSKTSYKKITLKRPENKDIIKGGDEFKMDDVRNALIRLKEVSDEMIKHITEKDRKDLNFIIRTVYKHQHDQAMYKKIYAVFIEIFGEFKDKLIPGTVAAYIIGCNNSTGHKDEHGCSPTCAGSSPDPDKGLGICSNRVILAIPDSLNSYTFTTLQISESFNCLIYIDKKTQFKGFDRKEIEILKNMHVKNAKIVSYDKFSKDLVDLTEMKPIEELQSRISEHIGTIQGKANDGVLYLILLIVFLIIIFMIWKLYKSK